MGFKGGNFYIQRLQFSVNLCNSFVVFFNEKGHLPIRARREVVLPFFFELGSNVLHGGEDLDSKAKRVYTVG